MIDDRFFVIPVILAHLFLASLFVWDGAGQDEKEDHLSLAQLLQDGSLPRVRWEQEVRARLNRESLGRILETLDELPQTNALALRRIIASGGPWMLGLIEALPEGGRISHHAQALLRASLGARPLARELPPPGEAALLLHDPFGNGRAGEGKALLFPGTWPGSRSLSLVLDRINEEAQPTHPFVLAPSLVKHDHFIHEKPMEGAATLVVQLLLDRAGLGVTYLESVALVHEGGNSIHDQAGIDSREDSLLLDDIFLVLTQDDEEEKARREAWKALAYLDLPGLFDGCYGDLAQGRSGACLEILLHGPCFHRLQAMLTVEENRRALLCLVQCYASCPPWTRLRNRLERLLMGLPRDRLQSLIRERGYEEEAWAALFIEPKAKKNREWMARITGSDPDARAWALKAAISWAPDRPERCMALYEHLRLCTEAGPLEISLMEDLLMKGMCRRLDDKKIAALIAHPLLRTSALEISETLGGSETLHTVVMDLIFRGEGGSAAVTCASRLALRLDPMESDELPALPLDLSTLQGRGATLTAGFMAALPAAWEQERDRINRAGPFLLDQVKKGDETALEAIPMFSFFTEGRIIPFLEPLLTGTDLQNARIRTALRDAMLRAAHSAPLDGSRIRLALRKIDMAPPYQAWFDAPLSLLADLSSLDSLCVAVDICYEKE